MGSGERENEGDWELMVKQTKNRRTQGVLVSPGKVKEDVIGRREENSNMRRKVDDKRGREGSTERKRIHHV